MEWMSSCVAPSCQLDLNHDKPKLSKSKISKCFLNIWTVCTENASGCFNLNALFVFNLVFPLLSLCYVSFPYLSSSHSIDSKKACKLSAAPTEHYSSMEQPRHQQGAVVHLMRYNTHRVVTTLEHINSMNYWLCSLPASCLSWLHRGSFINAH